MATSVLEKAAEYVLGLLNSDKDMKGWTLHEDCTLRRESDNATLVFSYVDDDVVVHKMIGGFLARPYFTRLDFSLESEIVPQIKVLMMYHAPLPDTATPAQRLMEAAKHIISMRATGYGETKA